MVIVRVSLFADWCSMLLYRFPGLVSKYEASSCETVFEVVVRRRS